MTEISYPFTAFNFSVEIYPDGKSAPLVQASFAECDGLEMSMEVKTIREGGANDRAVRVASAVSYSNLTLKRGMTHNFDLWKWFRSTIAEPSLRANAEVVLLAADGITEQARFQLHRCLPIKLKAPALNAKDGQIAVEEFQMAYEKLELAIPEGKAA
jgi:phage tail-like protein